MADGKKYFVFCDSNCRYESMTKEQILTAIENMATSGDIGDVDAGFITRIKDQNNGIPVKIWVGTQAQYNALKEKNDDTLYITDDSDAVSAVEEAIRELEESQREAVKCDGRYIDSASAPLTHASKSGLYFFPQLSTVFHFSNKNDTFQPVWTYRSGDGCVAEFNIQYDYALQRYKMQRLVTDREGGQTDYNEDIPFKYAALCYFDEEGTARPPELVQYEW